MYGLPLQKPGDSSTIKSNLGSAEISWFKSYSR